MNELLVITEEHLQITRILRVLKERTVKGHVIPRNKFRHSDCLVCVYNGKAVYSFSTHTVTVNTGDILYISKNSTYTYDILTETYEYIYLDFDFEISENVIGKSDIFPMKSKRAYLCSSFEKMNNLWLLKPIGYYEQCMAELYQVYSKLIQIKKLPYASPNARNLSSKAAMYIAEHCTEEEFKICQVVKELSCSDAHLRRIFKRDFGMSPTAYATNIKLEKAKSLLCNTDYGITQIADIVGFNDIYYFSRMFKQFCGCTPTEYRCQKKTLY